MKKRRKFFPSLRAIDVLRWISLGTFPFEQIEDSSIITMTATKTVRHTWFHRTPSGKIVKKSGTRRISKGIFLVRNWRDVPNWEIEMMKEAGMVPEPLGIFRFGDKYKRLCYSRARSLENARKMQDHIAEHYLSKTKFKVSEITDLVEIIEKVTRILSVTADRQIDLANFHIFVARRLQDHRRRLESFVNNSPFFRDRPTEIAKGAIGNSLLQIATDLRQFNFKNLYPQLRLAIRKLQKAYDSLHAGGYDDAEVYIREAIIYLDYPEPTLTKPGD